MTTPDAVLGVDVGTSAVKAAVVDAEGVVLATSEAPIRTHRPAPGLAEQDAEDWYASSCRAIRSCLEVVAAERIAAVAFDGPAHNVALLDDDGRVLQPVIHWSDTRSVAQAQQIGRHFGDLVRQQTLHHVQPAWTLAQLHWVRDHRPAVWAETRRFAVTKDYVRLRFGGRFGTDPYDAVGTQLYDVGRRRWSTELLDDLGWGDRELPDVGRATDVVGEVDEAVAADSGLRPGTPVALGSSDTLAEALAAGVRRPGGLLVKLGSSANVLLVADVPSPTTARWCTRTSSSRGGSR